jgi:NTP pyrophosphatase (non-canonical NTP hydrolase)
MGHDTFERSPRMDHLAILRDANTRRHIEWKSDIPIPLSFRGNELGGETGEVCNALKKIERFRMGMVGGSGDLTNLKEELADVIICVDLIAMDLDIDLGQAIRDKFNKTSEKNGLETKITDVM